MTKIIITESQLKTLIENKSETDIKQTIKYLKGMSKELKEDAVLYLKEYSRAKNGKVVGLSLHPDILKKIREKNLPDGFDMGIDKNGYYVHTHRARSKSHLKPSDITVKEIKFIDSTG